MSDADFIGSVADGDFVKSVNMKILSNTFVNSITANQLKILSTTTYVLECVARTQPYLLVLFYRSN